MVRWWYGPLDSFGDGAVALDLPALADLGALHIARFPGAGPIVLPALARAASVYVSEAPALTALELPALTDTKGVYVHGAGALARLDLGALERAGLGVASVSLPGTPAADGIKVEAAPALTSLDLGALREVATLWLLGLPLGALDLPSLVEADTIRFGEDSAIAWNQVTTPRLTGPVTPMDVVLPSLVRVGDAFFLHDRRIRRFDAPQLTAVDAYLRLHDLPNLATVRLPSLVDAAPGWLSFVHDPALLTVDLPALRTVGRLAAVDTALAAVDLPGLELATDQLTAYDNPALTSLRLPAVTASSALYLDHNPALVAIDLASLASTGSVWVGGHAALTALSLPALVEVATSVDVRDNPVLAALSLPALRRAGEVHVVGQPALDRCAVEAELADVAVAGEVEVEGMCGL
ncbi:MAG TPA: hypothetical protein PKA64_14000 [Myxococcota bacterium]|nr:hypothetical protein [Myxococcota bacterium]